MKVCTYRPKGVFRLDQLPNKRLRKMPPTGKVQREVARRFMAKVRERMQFNVRLAALLMQGHARERYEKAYKAVPLDEVFK